MSSLSPEQQSHLATLAKNGDRDAQNKLLAFVERDIRAITKKVKCSSARREDLAQEARIAVLVGAIPNFNPTAGKEFRFYAAWYIRTEIRRKHNSGSSVVTRNVRTLAESDVSLDATIGDDEDGASFLSGLADDAPSAEEAYIEAEDAEHVRQVMETVVARLTERESARYDKVALCRDIAYNRILSPSPVKLDDFAARYAVARETVRKLETALKARFQEALEAA